MSYDSSNRENSEQETSVGVKENTTEFSDRTSLHGNKEPIQSPNSSLTNPGQEARDPSHNHRTHNHITPAHHSTASQRKFFALVSDLGWNAEEVKERAAAHFKYDCFNELTNEQIGDLIEKMNATARAKGIDVD